ncbi:MULTISPECIES: caspase, EACC1-associated type [unclassified Streptomyces]|uniref:caspase, EACC1-associated type n=1 Tax=unclassified Streptomyces TaxID=2593676 RepID=UPI00225C23AA|nr:MULTISPECIES: caspase family protein [unclassified Streptomyces]MCX5050212.1 caspase family protein [Streptomyces sp. NBC_00474]MCX5060589.1 caspase family protein [Streptomyces sp. NBC_00452]MCX5248123.1 caspase family protein [Streptomyces sp. NBC_00201]MCX5293821.1 caspase family protein [Streptomyces sp. NBC_00183]
MRLPDPRRSRAVLLGFDTFTDPGLPDLPAVTHNVEDLVEVLTSPWGTALPDGHCVRRRKGVPSDLTDSASVGARLVSAAKEAEDLLLVYYAGHGVVGPDGELYLSLPSTSSEPDLVPWTGIPFSLVRRTLANARADSRVLILDCCFSGLAIGAMATTTSVVAGQLEVAGTCTLASSPANRPSSAPVGARHTAYTGELLDLLKHGTTEAAEFLTLQTIHEHLARVLPSKGHPRPELRGTHTVGRLALARNRARSGISDPEAMVKEATRLERIGDSAGAVHWYRQAAGAGRSNAMRELGRLLERSGHRVEAGLWRGRAAESGDPTAMYELGVTSWHTGNLAEAERWLGRAAAAGVPGAAEDLERLLRRQRGRATSNGEA